MVSSALTLCLAILPVLVAAAPFRPVARLDAECCAQAIDVCAYFIQSYVALNCMQVLSPLGINILGLLGIPEPPFGDIGINCADVSLGGVLYGSCGVSNIFVCATDLVCTVREMLSSLYLKQCPQPDIIPDLSVSLGCQPLVTT